MRTIKILFLGFFLFLSFVGRVSAQSCGSDLTCLNNLINQYQNEIKKLQGQANTLSNQIAQFNAQINLTQLKINQTEEKIALLGGRIDQLAVSLSNLNDAFSSRVVETYKIARFSDGLTFVITAGDIGEIFSRFHYLRKIQEGDRSLLLRLTNAQNTYKEEKTDQEKLQEELEGQQQVLGAQKTAKAQLLSVTKNDERRYQELLASARAELAAISAIIAGKGEETEVRRISEGERIASILTTGPNLYACSSGPHLHFEVVKDSAQQDPFNFLSGKSLIWDNVDPERNGTGGWQWPLSDPIRITQSFGHTSYSSRYAGGLHTGIDMTNTQNLEVKAVKPGTLYRGGIGCRGGTLQYVRVKQDDGYDTYYLHVNY